MTAPGTIQEAPLRLTSGQLQRGPLTAIFLLFTGLNVFLSFNFHSHGARHSYVGALWADRAGYFVYLPLSIETSTGGLLSAHGLDTLTGNGFKFDRTESVVRTKYTSGVALMQAPIYLIAHALGAIGDFNDGPFESIDHAVVCISGPLYGCIGLALLFKVFRKRNNERTVLFLLFTLYAGTNLFYYAVCDPGMSHVYSFFLFSAFLALLHDLQFKGRSVGRGVLLGALAGTILLVRPTNVVFLLTALPVATGTVDGVKTFLHHLSKPRFLAVILLSAVLIWLPQLVYWHVAFGSFITWPYSGESFTEWRSPNVLLFLFSTNNGLFPYSPLFMLALFGAFRLWRTGMRLVATATIIAFTLVILIGSAWWVWHFGCGFGSRTLVEYTALIFPSLLAVHGSMAQRNLGKLASFVMLLLVVVELKMVYSYGACWFHGDWNWDAYAQLILGPTK